MRHVTDEGKLPDPGRLSGWIAGDGDGPRPALAAGIAALLALFTALVAADAIADARTGGSAGHIALELAIMALALAGAAALALRVVAVLRRARLLQGRLWRAEKEAARFREESRDHLRGLAEAIDRQLERWSLSPAEREVALLLLKGLSHKEIGGLRSTSERTVRQQALSVYRKAGLAGRAELAAFFLEDLLVPPGPPAAPRASSAP
jgi:DNA-binding CsgD family transcriptional regulator